MADNRATTIRFSEPMYARLEDSAAETGLTINAIVVVACLEWLDHHHPEHRVPGSMDAFHMLGSPIRPSASWRRVLGGRGGRRPYDSLTLRARAALAVAQGQAKAADRGIAPEHLLAGLIADPSSIAAQALVAAGFDASGLAERADAIVTEDVPEGAPTARLKRLLEAAFDEAHSHGHAFVGAEHLLLAAFRDERLADVAERTRPELDRLLTTAWATPGE